MHQQERCVLLPQACRSCWLLEQRSLSVIRLIRRIRDDGRRRSPRVVVADGI